MVNETKGLSLTGNEIHCACVIHGDAYSWIYVERLHNMLVRNLSFPVKLHVYTEKKRKVPDHMIKHTLDDFGISGPKKAWWYKMQLFNKDHYSGPLLYFDLDTVIVDNIDWIVRNNPKEFWAVQDFRRLYKPNHSGYNSSVMWWDTAEFDWIWQDFKTKKIPLIMRQFNGDQDYISAVMNNRRRFLDYNRIISWRWQALDGGYDFRRRTWCRPRTGTEINGASVLVFHGNPKPDQISDPVIQRFWC